MKLYKYQKDYMENVQPNWLYDCDTGTGKTIMGLEHACKFYPNKPVLIVAPASKLKEGGWQRTIKDYYPQIQYKTCTYNMLAKKYTSYLDWFVIFDECHRLKNSTGKWGKAGYNLTKIACGFILMSATPIPNGWIDAINYFKMFKFTDCKTHFLDKFAVTTIQYKHLVVVKWLYEDTIKAMWDSISKRLSKKNAIDLPDLTFTDILFKPSKDYKTIKKDRVLNDVIYNDMMSLRHALRLHTNLNDKISYLNDFVESTTDNIVIFYNYDEELSLLRKNITKKLYICNGKVKNYPKKDEWDKVNNTVTLANYKSGSEAVEFTYANIIIYFSPTDSYTEYYQSYGRCYRNGQDKKVSVYKFITLNTIEEKIYTSLSSKQDFNFKLWEQKEGFCNE